MKAIAILALSIALEAGFLFTVTAPASSRVGQGAARAVTASRAAPVAPVVPAAPLRRS
jgi:hypothetical protein